MNECVHTTRDIAAIIDYVTQSAINVIEFTAKGCKIEEITGIMYLDSCFVLFYYGELLTDLLGHVIDRWQLSDTDGFE